MRSKAAKAFLVVMVLAVLVTPLMLRGASPQAAAPADNDMPRRTVNAFAPFIRAIVTRRVNQAERIFKMPRSVETSLDQAGTVRIYGRFLKPDQMQLNLIGGRLLGQNIGILLFTIATEDGPVTFKVYYYGFGNDMTVARLDITDDWDQLEQMAATVDILAVPVTAPLGGNDNGQ